MGLGLISFLVTVAYVPGIPSGAVSPRWWVLAIGLAILHTLGWRPWRSGWGGWCFAALLAYAAASLLWSIDPLSTGLAVFQLAILGTAFMAGAQETDLKPFWYGIAAGLAINAVVLVLQLANVPIAVPRGNFSALTGLFLNRDSLADLGALAVIGLCAYRPTRAPENAILDSFFPAAMTAALMVAIIPASRSAWLALAICGLVTWLSGYSRRARIQIVLMIFVLAMVFAAADVYLDDSGRRLLSLQNRLVFWDWTIANLTPFGWGLGTYPSVFVFEHAHNEVLEYAFELGAPSALLWAVFIYAIGAPQSGERLVLLGLFVEALVGFPLHDPATAFVGAVCLGRCCAARSALRQRQSWSRAAYSGESAQHA